MKHELRLIALKEFFPRGLANRIADSRVVPVNADGEERPDLAYFSAMDVLRTIPLLSIEPEIIVLAQYLLHGGGLPAKAKFDASHIACAAYHRMDVLLTWNCTHIANPMQLPVIRGLCAAKGYRLPELVTPFEMLEGTE